MAKFRVTVPYQPDMGSVLPFIATSSPMESSRDNALWHLNSMRRHDGLQELSRLPRGTTLEPVED